MRADPANQRNSAERSRSALLLVPPVLILIAGTIYMQYRTQDRGFDDAYISFRYAQNLVEGHGLVYNPGERVQGYSNLLYTLLSALGIALFGPDNVYTFSLVVKHHPTDSDVGVVRWGRSAAEFGAAHPGRLHRVRRVHSVLVGRMVRDGNVARRL
jgi:hypothetical protein